MIEKLNRIKNGLTRKNDNGFTLIELMIVVVIIAILAAIAIPIFANQQTRALEAGVKSDVKNTATEVMTYLTKSPTADAWELMENVTPVRSASSGDIFISPHETSPDANAYLVKGFAAYGVSSFCWQFDSTTGKSSECGLDDGGGEFNPDDFAPCYFSYDAGSQMARSDFMYGPFVTDTSMEHLIEVDGSRDLVEDGCESAYAKGYTDARAGIMEYPGEEPYSTTPFPSPAVCITDYNTAYNTPFPDDYDPEWMGQGDVEEPSYEGEYGFACQTFFWDGWDDKFSGSYNPPVAP